ncbi:MAG: DUF6055 domain-containing protein [Anaerolineales bacterium]
MTGLTRWSALLLWLLLGWLLVVPAARAQADEGVVQGLSGTLVPAEGVAYYILPDMQAGDTLYAHVASDDFDTFIGVGDLAFDAVYAHNDDIDYNGGNLNSALAYTFAQDGDYTLAITDCCDRDAGGAFRLVVGLNAPEAERGEVDASAVAQIARLPTDGLARPARFGLGLIPTDCSVLEDRPELSGPPLRREGDDFVIHYTTQGFDAATENYINEVYIALQATMQYQIDRAGWAHPPRDCGEGGDDRFDLYIMDVVGELGGVLGYSSPEGLLGDNPYTATEEEWAAYSFLVIDNDFEGLGRDPLALMRATTAHEFHHVIQFGYDVDDGLEWVYEATATWMETQTFPEDEDASPYVIDLFSTPQHCVGYNDGSLRIYAEWLLLDSIAQDYGPQAILSLWDYMAEEDGMAVYYNWLESLGTTPQEVLRRFAVRNILLGYDLSERFDATVRLEAQAPGVGTYTPRGQGVEELAANYVQITQPGLYHLTLQEADLALLLVGVDETTGEAEVFDLSDGGGVVDTRPFTYTYALILNEAAHTSPDECFARNWTLKINSGEGLPLLAQTPLAFDASRFVPNGQRAEDAPPPVEK